MSTKQDEVPAWLVLGFLFLIFLSMSGGCGRNSRGHYVGGGSSQY